MFLKCHLKLLKAVVLVFSSVSKIGIAARNSVRLVRYGSVGLSDASSPAVKGATRPTVFSKLAMLARMLLALLLGILLRIQDL